MRRNELDDAITLLVHLEPQKRIKQLLLNQFFCERVKSSEADFEFEKKDLVLLKQGLLFDLPQLFLHYLVHFLNFFELLLLDLF